MFDESTIFTVRLAMINGHSLWAKGYTNALAYNRVSISRLLVVLDDQLSSSFNFELTKKLGLDHAYLTSSLTDVVETESF